MNLARIRSVAGFEWRGVVYRPSYWLGFLFPIVITALAAGVMMLIPISDPAHPSAKPLGEGLAATPKLLRALVSFGFVFPFLLALILGGGQLLLGMVEERETRVGEVLLASIRADELIAGKLLGLGTAVVLQMFVWSVIVALIAGATPAVRPAIPPLGALVVAGVILMLGEFFLASVFLAAAGFGSSARASQQIMGYCMMITMLPLTVGMQILIQAPHGVAARAMSWFPFTAPVVMSLRVLMASEGVAWLEVAGVAALLFVAALWTARLAARLYRVSLVSAGSGIGWRALLRQARLD